MSKNNNRKKASNANEAQTIVERRKKITQWSKEAALKAIQLEDHYYSQQTTHKTQTELVITFPDPVINEALVKSYSDKITAVNFPQSIAPRECIVKLKDCDTKKTIKELSKVKFGSGKLNVKEKRSTLDKLEEIDPLTLCITNLPSTKICKLKNILKNTEIQIAQNKRKPHKTQAFAKFSTFEDSVQAFRKCMRKFPPSQFINIRFKRTKIQNNSSTHNDNEQNSQNGADDKNDSFEATNEEEQINLLESTSHSETNEVNSSHEVTETISISAIASSDHQHPDEFDPNKEIKIEPGTEKYLGFSKDSFDDDDMDGETDCSESTYRYDSNSVGSIDKTSRRRRSSSSVYSVTDSDEETTMKKPKLLVLPMELHGSLQEVKEEESETSDDDISVIEDLDLI